MKFKMLWLKCGVHDRLMAIVGNQCCTAGHEAHARTHVAWAALRPPTTRTCMATSEDLGHPSRPHSETLRPLTLVTKKKPKHAPTASVNRRFVLLPSFSCTTD